MRSKLSVIAVILSVSFALTGCVSVSSGSKASPQIYQPIVLRLPAGQPIKTLEGTYIPQGNETWHSDQRFRDLERENIDLAAALQALRK